jgi:3-isopropylmalate dehydrogenase
LTEHKKASEKKKMPPFILVLPGDGVGAEVCAEAEKVLDALAADGAFGVAREHGKIGGAALDAGLPPLPPQTLSRAKESAAVLLGAVGAPRFDNLPAEQRPERGLLQIRRELGLFANLRPATCHPALAGASPLRRELARQLDLLIVRELTGGLYFGEPRGVSVGESGRVGINTLRYGEGEIRRIARVAFIAAGKRNRRLCSVDKANVLESSQLWRAVVGEVAADFADVEVSHLYVDNAAMQLARAPGDFDVIVAGNLFGDILSDEAAALAGSIGLLPSASLNDSGRGLYEPVHGAAPDIAGRGVANPLAMILSAAMMLRHSFGDEKNAARIEAAVSQTLSDGLRTADIARLGDAAVGCAEMGDAVVARL